LEVLNQLTRDKIYAISKNKDFFLQNLYFSHGVAKPTISGANCFEYYFSQTVGGVVGFIDLFPHQTTFYNDAVVTKVRIKTFIFFNKIRGILIKKVRALGSYRVATSITSKRLNKFKDSAIKRPTIFTDFLASRLYLEPEFSFFYRNFDWLFNVSKLGDYGVLKLRRYFFKAAVWARDP
jgi:hypothetical protein